MSKSSRKNGLRNKRSGSRNPSYVPSEPAPKANGKSLALRVCLYLLLIVGVCVVWFQFQDSETDGRDREEIADSAAVAKTVSLATQSEEELETLLKLPSRGGSEKATPDIEVSRLASEFDEVIQAFKAEYPADPQAEHLHGLFHLRLKRTQLAEPSLRRCVELAPEDEQMRMDLAELLTQLGRDEEALTTLEDGPKKPLQRVEFLWLLGESQLRFGRLDGAETTLTQATQSYPLQPALWVQLGKIQLQRQKADEALVNAKKAIELDANEPEAWLLLNRVYSLRKQSTEAQEALNRWRELKEKSKDQQPRRPFEVQHPESMAKVLGSAFRSLANLFQSKGRPAPMTIAMFERALEIDPQDTYTLADYAGFQRRLRNFNKAAALNCELIQRKPMEVAYYQNLANIWMELERPFEAEAALRLACLRLPDNGQGHLLLAKFLLLTNKPNEAVTPAKTAVQILKSNESSVVLQQAESLLRPNPSSHSTRRSEEQ